MIEAGSRVSTTVFYSKIMLFGEYSIILGSMGLTIPYAHFNGGLEFINQNQYTDLDYARNSNRQLADFLKYIANPGNKSLLPNGFNLDLMTREIDIGLYFESTIPEGYGLGSSGALVASLYYRYAGGNPRQFTKANGYEITKLKSELANLESYFHGTSSGIDPLICYLKHPFLLKNNNTIIPIEIPVYKPSPGDAIFLVNSGKPGKTAPLVKEFMLMCKNPNYRGILTTEYIPVNNSCIQILMDGDLDSFFPMLGELSRLQAVNFKQVIPPNLEPAWQHGLSTGKFYLKLCGSGGGGFILGFTRHYSETRKWFADNNLEIIPVYQSVKIGKGS